APPPGRDAHPAQSKYVGGPVRPLLNPGLFGRAWAEPRLGVFRPHERFGTLMAYSILLRPAAIRDLKSLPSGVRSRIEKAIDRLVDDPRTSGTRKLVGFDDEWRLRVGDYRVLYIINGPERQVVIARVARRREAYR